MKTRCLFFVFIIFAWVGAASAQTKSLTNADLETYRQNRLNAEQDYLENFERLGMPSPAEIGRRNEQSAKEMAELSNRLRAEEFERDRIAAQRVTVLRFQRPEVVGVSDNTVYSYFWRNRGYHWMPHRRQYTQPGYFAGGQFWPAGSATPSRPLIAPAHR